MTNVPFLLYLVFGATTLECFTALEESSHSAPRRLYVAALAVECPSPALGVGVRAPPPLFSVNLWSRVARVPRLRSLNTCICHAHTVHLHVPPRGYGATAARLTPDQKGGSSNLSGFISPSVGGLLLARSQSRRSFGAMSLGIEHVGLSRHGYLFARAPA